MNIQWIRYAAYILTFDCWPILTVSFRVDTSIKHPIILWCKWYWISQKHVTQIVYISGCFNLFSDVSKVENFICFPWSFDLVHKVSKMTRKLEINSCFGCTSDICVMCILNLCSKHHIEKSSSSKILLAIHHLTRS